MDVETLLTTIASNNNKRQTYTQQQRLRYLYTIQLNVLWSPVVGRNSNWTEINYR